MTINTADVRDILLLVPWLSQVEGNVLDLMVAKSRLVKMGNGQSLPSGQQSIRHFAVVADGRIEISVSNKSGKRHVLGVLGRGQAFGFISLFDSNPRFYNLVSIGAVTLVSVPQDVMLDCMQASRILLTGLMEILGQRTHQAYRALADQHLLSPTARLSRYLTDVVSQYSGVNASDKDVTVIELPQSEIADVIGVSRQSLSIALKQLERKGLIQLRYSKIALRDLAGLEALVAAEI